MLTLHELMHWIVASIGYTETLLILLTGLVWLIYVVWTRSQYPPRGTWRWGIWIPLGFCIQSLASGTFAKWEFYNLMMKAGAFNEPQADLYIQRGTFGAFKLLLVGIVGTIFIRLTIRRERQPPSETSPQPQPAVDS